MTCEDTKIRLRVGRLLREADSGGLSDSPGTGNSVHIQGQPSSWSILLLMSIGCNFRGSAS